jgi:hypothetical protein
MVVRRIQNKRLMVERALAASDAATEASVVIICNNIAPDLITGSKTPLEKGRMELSMDEASQRRVQ